MTPQTKPETDDPEISNADVLHRHVKTFSQLARHADGHLVYSSKIFSPNDGGCSVEIESLLNLANETAASRAVANNSCAVVSVTVQEVRSLRYGKPRALGVGQPKEPQDRLYVAYTPIPAGETDGPNPFHGDIFPGPTDSAEKKLTVLAKARADLVPLDQALAEAEWAKKHGIET